MSYGVGRRRTSDLVLLWLWHKPAATAPIRPLAWEPPYAVGYGPGKRQKKKKKRERERSVGPFLSVKRSAIPYAYNIEIINKIVISTMSGRVICKN